MTSYGTGVLRLTWAEVCTRRLERHALSAPSQKGHLAETVAAMCGVHAQVLSAAELSIAVRVADLTRADLHKALWNEHSLIKTFGPRGTVHLLPAHELSMWCGALTALPTAQNAMDKEIRMTAEQTEEVIQAIDVILAETELTVDDLTEAIVAKVGSWAGDLVMPAFQGMWPRWRQITHVAAHRGVLCFGPNQGRKVTYTNPRRWLPNFRPMPGEAALAALVKRYLHAYGPATPQHFAQWLAIPRRRATDVFDALAGELQQVELDGIEAWLVAGDAAMPSTPAQGVWLLPYFDAYVVGSHPRELLFPGRAAERALARGQAGNFPVLLIDGVVAGVWHQQRSGRKLNMTVEPFGPLTLAQRCELDDQVEAVANFLDAKPQLTIGTVTVGAHA
jgi:hypothetical protein